MIGLVKIWKRFRQVKPPEKFLAMQRLRYVLKTKGIDPVHFNVEEIPDQWELFPGTNDLWMRVPFPESEDLDSALYHAKAGSWFPPHFHKNVELMMVMTPGATVELYTPEYFSTFSFGESMILEKELEHSAYFPEECKVLVIWTPKFKSGGWDAEFISQLPGNKLVKQ